MLYSKICIKFKIVIYFYFRKDPIERMKAVLSFVYAGLTLSISQLKPFTPLLGETYEVEFDDGTKIYSEHIIHHPPIISYYIVGNGFKYYGICIKFYIKLRKL